MNALAEFVVKSTPLHVGFAFVAMGGWALYANAGHPFPARLSAAVVQGAMSACLTLFLKRSVDWMQPMFSPPSGYVVPALVASLASATLLVLAHFLARTPEIVRTIAVPLTVSATYIFSYGFIRQRRALEDHDE